MAYRSDSIAVSRDMGPLRIQFQDVGKALGEGRGGLNFRGVAFMTVAVLTVLAVLDRTLQ